MSAPSGREAEAAGDDHQQADDVCRPVRVIREQDDRVRDQEQIDREDETRDRLRAAAEASGAKKEGHEHGLPDEQHAEEHDVRETDIRKERAEHERDRGAADPCAVEGRFEALELDGADRGNGH